MPDKKSANALSRLWTAVLDNKVFFILVLLVLVIGNIAPVFLKIDNIWNVLRQVTASTILSLGFTVVIASGHFDLSVGSNLGLTAVIMAILMVNGAPVRLAILVGICCAVIFACINATFISVFSLAPFIVTLATKQIFRGSVYLITNMKAVFGLPTNFQAIGQGYLGVIPIPILIMVFCAIVIYILINKSTFGRHALAIGGNADAARASGINVVKTRYGVYIVMGICTAIAAIIVSSRSASAQVSAGLDMEMDAIAAVVVGGTSMKGGNANVFGTVVGCLIVGVVNNGLNMMQVDSNWQVIAKGAMILFAIIMDVASTRIVRSSQKKKMIEKS